MNLPDQLLEKCLTLRTIPMPRDLNVNGDIFGGWIMSQMDIAGGMHAKATANGRIATVAVNAMKFIRPVKVDDAVCVYTKLANIGKTSITIHIDVWVDPPAQATDTNTRYPVAEADFVYVAIDDHGKKRLLHKTHKQQYRKREDSGNLKTCHELNR